MIADGKDAACGEREGILCNRVGPIVPAVIGYGCAGEVWVYRVAFFLWSQTNFLAASPVQGND